MSEIDVVSIQKTVRAMAAKELVDRKIVADLLFQTRIIECPTSLQNNQMDIHPFKLFLGEVFRGDFDCLLSARLRELFPGGLSYISDRLEESWRTEQLSTQGESKGQNQQKFNTGSGHKKKAKVEECFVIDVEQVVQWGILLPHYPRFGFMLFFKTLTGSPLLCMWQINRSEKSSVLGLTYLVPNSKKVKSSSIEIWCSKTSDKNQTQKYWLRCPHEDEGASQLPYRRLMYLPPGAETFKCSQCQDLERHRSRSMEGLDLSVPLFFLPPNP